MKAHPYALSKTRCHYAATRAGLEFVITRRPFKTPFYSVAQSLDAAGMPVAIGYNALLLARVGEVIGMAINGQRLWRRIEQLAAFTESQRPYTRRAFTELHRQSRVWLRSQFEEAGLSVATDAGGNLIGRLGGANPSLKPILTGSHSDTVPQGGRFDGIAGVLAGLEVAHALSDCGARMQHPLEVVDFLSEEPSDYGVSCVGSRAMVGRLTPEMLQQTAADNSKLRDAINGVGGQPARLNRPLRPAGSIAGFFELHIEQGPVLEAEGLDIGIVTDIVGIRRLGLVVKGAADHAGTTPMGLRRDALVGAAKIVSWVNDYACSGSDEQTYLVGTVGKLEVIPNGANVVPGEVRMTLEMRGNSETKVDEFAVEAVAFAKAVCGEMGLDFSHALLSASTPMSCHPFVQTAIEQACRERGAAYRSMASGAGHDAAYMGRLGPSGMIFIPCLSGRSHCPEEWASAEQLALGAQILLDAMLIFDQSRC